ncbi:hypothetical protein [Thermosporothrix hazakensis]|nr:hypothetical protein [Thermosporothrix hazakensis]BBH89447.1 hypothetical protein KTC_41980 [Thermosporothrix sp. COM3]GCE47630.1 hypothetical protein KTH_24990 [Thermosporothrix hazakensis]
MVLLAPLFLSGGGRLRLKAEPYEPAAVAVLLSLDDVLLFVLDEEELSVELLLSVELVLLPLEELPG